MIYLNEPSENKQEFETLLQRVKVLSLGRLSHVEEPSTLGGTAFELLVFDAAKEASVGTIFEGKIDHTSDAAFPDIVAAGYFGMEVKATQKDAWTSIGNSVLESSRIKSVEKIYMFFGKLGGQPDIIYRNYEDCLKGIAVTHYPRYVIDMNLSEGKSIFDKMKVSYDSMRQSTNPVHHVREYYKNQLKEGQTLWWIDDNSDKMPILSPIIKSFTSLKTADKDMLKATIIILFPEILSRSTSKFENVAAYLISEHGIISSNLRDHFTAGGQVKIKLNGVSEKIPQVLSELARLTPSIKNQIKTETEKSLSTYWRKKINNFSNPEEAWKREVDSQAAWMDLNIKPSELYESVLKDDIDIES